MFTWITNQIKAQDYFAERVSLTQKGNKDFKSFCGGLVSIITCASVFVYGLLRVLDLYCNPEYNSYPVTVDFDYDKVIKVDWQKNMPSYQLLSPDYDSNPLETLRVVFIDHDREIVPAVYCSEYFDKQIAAEQSGQSDSTFNYTQAYGYQGTVVGISKWICPNLTETTITNSKTLKV